MMIIGCDFHPSWQQVSWLDTETGETGEQKLVQASGDAERFYRRVAAPALIGMEATGNCHWLVDLLSELGHELWVGDAAQIRASYVRQQKTDKRDAAHILKLLEEGRFPRVWIAGGSGASRSSLRSPVSQRVFASLPQEAESGGQGGSGAQVGGTAVLDAAHAEAVSGYRSHREQPAGAPGRRELDRRN